MGKVWCTSMLLGVLWLATSVSGCVATSGDLLKVKQEVLESFVDQTESLESHKAETRIQFDALKSDLIKSSQDLKADCHMQVDGVRSGIAKVSQELTGLRERVADLDIKSASLVQEREKVHAALQTATRRMLVLFKTEESELKDRIRFLQETIKEYGAEEAGKMIPIIDLSKSTHDRTGR
jgi:chromosome segregation ATPase